MTQIPHHFAQHLRLWRSRRRFSQLHLAAEAEISQRHLSFLESGRANPSREMVLRLAETLEVPLRDRNQMLGAAGFAPVYPDAAEGPGREEVQRIVARVVEAHAPHPALAVDRHWTLLVANKAAMGLMAGVAAHLMEGPVNVLRLSLHPEGLAPRILNLPDWRAHVLHRLDRQVAATADPVLADLRAELAALPYRARGPAPRVLAHGLFVPLVLATPAGPLSFLSTTTVFGTPLDVGLSEIAVEAFLPADPVTAAALRPPALSS